MTDAIYSDDLVTLYHGDCGELMPEVLARHGIPAHVLTDPPYAPRTHAGARTMRGGVAGGVALVDFASTTALDVRRVLAACAASRWTIAFVDHAHAAELAAEPPDGMRAVRTAAWVKPDGAPQLTGDRPAQGHEAIVILHADGAMRWNGGGKRGVWTCGVERDVPWHPTPKPVALLRKLLRDFTDPGDLVIDPFAGSGSTAVACRIEGRRCVALEINAEYAGFAAQRLSEGRARPRHEIDMPTDGVRALALFAGGAK